MNLGRMENVLPSLYNVAIVTLMVMLGVSVVRFLNGMFPTKPVTGLLGAAGMA